LHAIQDSALSGYAKKWVDGAYSRIKPPDITEAQASKHLKEVASFPR
jgi:hypothetical protein